MNGLESEKVDGRGGRARANIISAGGRTRECRPPLPPLAGHQTLLIRFPNQVEEGLVMRLPRQKPESLSSIQYPDNHNVTSIVSLNPDFYAIQ